MDGQIRRGAGMPTRPKILDYLRDVKGHAADEALIAGFAHATPDLQKEMVDLFLERGSDAAQAALPERYDSLDPATQSKIVLCAARLAKALGATIRRERIETRANTLTIVQESGNPRLAYLAANALHDGSSIIRGQGAATLRSLTEQHARNHGQTAEMLQDVAAPGDALTPAAIRTLGMLTEERGALILALKEALDTFESHHRTDVVEAGLLLAEELEESFLALTVQRRGKLTHVVFDVLTERLSPEHAHFAYFALAQPELRNRMALILSRCTDAAFFHALLRRWWMSRDPRVRTGLRGLRSLAWLKNNFEAAFTLPTEIARLAPAWLQPIGLPVEEKIAALKTLILLDDRPTTLSAIWTMVELKNAASTRALEEAVVLEDPIARRIAQRELEHRQRVMGNVVRRVPSGRPIEWVDLMSAGGLHEDFEHIWEYFERVPQERALRGGRHALAFVEGFEARLRERSLARDPQQRVRAAQLTVHFGLAESFREDLFRLAKDARAEVRAAGVTALGRLGDATSRRILSRAVGDDAPVVQTAAIEALDLIGAPNRESLIGPLTTSEDAQVRATALRVLVKQHVPAAAAGLLYMLNDHRADHRCAAVWVVDQLRLTALAARIAEMAEKDADERVKRIAENIRGRLAVLAPAAAEVPKAGGGA